MKLINKIKLVFAAEILLIVVMVILAGRFAIDTGTASLKETIEEELLHHSSDIMAKIETSIDERVGNFREYTSDLILLDALKRSNTEFERMSDAQAYINRIDSEWISAPPETAIPIMDKLIGNELARELSEKIIYNNRTFGQTVYGEVFATNRFGAVVAMTGRTSDYRQDDEQWWQQAHDNGISMTDVYFDRSTGTSALAAGIRVDDKEGNFMGVIKVVIDIGFIETLMKVDPETEIGRPHDYMKHTLIGRHGRVIFSTGNMDDSEVIHLLDRSLDFAMLDSDELVRDNEHLTVSMHVHSGNTDTTMGLDWSLFVTTRAQELYQPVTLIQRGILVVTISVIVLVIVVGAYSTKVLSRYLMRMRQAMAHVDAGELDAISNGDPHDELTGLAAAFKRMTEDIKSSTVSRRYLDDLMSNVTTPLLVLRSDGTIKHANSAAEVLLGYSEGGLAGTPVSELVITGQERPIDAVIDNGIADRVSATIRNMDGRWIPALFSCTTIREEESDEDEVICSLQDITEQLELEEMISRLSYHDTLTGLPNKQQFVERLAQVMALGQRRGMRGAVLMLDLDRFKDINDAFGHSFGDDLLKSVAARLTSKKRSYDAIARLGGDEFAMIVLDIEGPEDIMVVVERVLAALKSSHVINGREIYITPSIGISVFPDDGDDPETLLKYADAALNRAKSEHREPFKFFAQSMHSDIARRFDMEYRLNKALENNEFILHYQSEVDTRTGRIIGFEALVRWQDPEGGLVPPGEFIPVAENTGLIIPLGEWVLRNAAMQALQWQNMGFGDIKVAVNLSFRQFRQRGFIDNLTRIIEETGVDPGGSSWSSPRAYSWTTSRRSWPSS